MDIDRYLRAHRERLVTADPATIQLARVLHCVAFEGKERDGAGDLMRGDFEPGPLYLDQAILVATTGWGRTLMDAILEAKGIS